MSIEHRQDDLVTAQEERKLALSRLMETFAEAQLDGLAEDSLTQAALFVAFRNLVACYGEEPVAVFAERLPDRIRHGEFTTSTRQ